MGLERRLRRLEAELPSPRRKLEALEGKQPDEMSDEELVAVMLGHWPSREELDEVMGKYRTMSVEELFALVRELEEDSASTTSDSTSGAQLDKV